MNDSKLLNPITIAVIDDNVEFGIGIKLLLAKDGVEVHTASDGIEGLNLVRRLLPDIVILDVVMPGLNGIEVCKKIREAPELSDLLIVMLSGIKTQTDQMADGLEAGADGYIARPIPNRELLARLRAYIRIKRSEKALKVAETKYQRLFDTMIMAYAHHRIILDDHGSAIDYKFLEINPEFERVTGAKRESLIGKTVLEVYPQTEKKWIDTYGQVVKTGKEMRFVNYSVVVNKYFEVYAFSPAKGEFSTLFYDVTERELARKQIETYSRELEKLNNDKDKFFSIIAHDLKSPFNSILGFSELLLEKVREKDFESIDQYARIIRQASQMAMDLLTNLLEWSRNQTGRMDYNPEQFDLRDVIKGVFAMFEEIAEQKSITIIEDISDDLLVFADKSMISTVIRNLISNAIKFTGKGGKVIISTRTTDEDLIVTVKDNGVGIAPERVEKLFRVDTCESTPGTNKEKGTGLGLVLCKEFVEKHDGRIWVESEEGKGSVFCFTLPDITKP